MDQVNRVRTIFSNDTSQAEAAVKRLRGVERDRAKSLLDDLNAGNSKLESQIAVWTKIGAVIGAGIGTYALLSKASKAYLEDVRLGAAAAGASLERLQAATQGLVEEDNLLRFAGQAMHGTWRLNQEEMDLVLKSALAIRKQFGVELTPTVEKLGEAIAKGATRSLREFGIEAKSKQELFRELNGIIAGTGETTALAGDEMERASVKWKNALDNLMGQLGRIAVALTPVVSMLGDMAEAVATAAEKMIDFMSRSEGDWVDRNIWGIQGPNLFTPEMLNRPERTLVRSGGGDFFAGLEFQLMQMRKRDAESFTEQFWSAWNEGTFAFRQGIKAFLTKPKARRGGATAAATLVSGNPVETVTDLAAAIRAAVGDVGEAIADPSLRGWRPLSEAAGKTETGIEGISNGAEAAANIASSVQLILEQTKGKTVLETIFGTPSEIDVTMESLKLLGQGFDTVFNAAGAAMDAWITGQKSLGRAFTEAITQGLRGIAVQATVEALKHTAFGVGALAFGPIMGQTAAQHFAAAALFGGVAVAAGAGARALGGATGQFRASAPAGAALGGGPSRDGAAVGAGERTNVIMLGRDFLGLTDLEQRDLLYRAIKQGNGQVQTTTIRRE